MVDQGGYECEQSILQALSSHWLWSLQIARVIGRGTPPGEGRRDKVPVWRRLVQQCHSLGIPEVGVAKAPAETKGSIAFI